MAESLFPIRHSFIGSNLSALTRSSTCRRWRRHLRQSAHDETGHGPQERLFSRSSVRILYREQKMAASRPSCGAKPRSGSMSRNTSSQPLSLSHCLRATASSSSALEWLRKMQDIRLPDRSSIQPPYLSRCLLGGFKFQVQRVVDDAVAYRLPVA